MQRESHHTISALVIALALMVLHTAAYAGGPSTPAEKKAVAAAEGWLKLTDTKQYAKSWTEAASSFRKAVERGTWEKQAAGVRDPLGKVITRKVKSVTAATSLPGAPDGEYVVIQFTTSFAHKHSAVETVTPMKDSDGKWRVSGYYIK